MLDVIQLKTWNWLELGLAFRIDCTVKRQRQIGDRRQTNNNNNNNNNNNINNNNDDDDDDRQKGKSP